LPAPSDIDPKTGNVGYRGTTRIGFETEHILIKSLHGIELWRFRVDPDGMMVDFENANAHRGPPRV
jgi:hypothetical protein